MGDLSVPTPSAELRALVRQVAAGEVSPDVATEAIARWMVLTIRACGAQELLALAEETEADFARRDSNDGSTYCIDCGAPQGNPWEHDDACHVAKLRARAASLRGGTAGDGDPR